MISVTTPTVENGVIVEYKGIVTGQVVNGVNFIKDFGASIRRVGGGAGKRPSGRAGRDGEPRCPAGCQCGCRRQYRLRGTGSGQYADGQRHRHRSGGAEQMTDRILIRGLRLFGYHGVNPEEKIQGQRFEIDADLYVNLAKACHSDRVEDTVSYAKVIKTLRRVFTERTNDLLERTAEDLTAAVLAEYPEVLRVDLTLKKPQAPIQADFDWVGVTISRDRK